MTKLTDKAIIFEKSQDTLLKLHNLKKKLCQKFENALNKVITNMYGTYAV